MEDEVDVDTLVDTLVLTDVDILLDVDVEKLIEKLSLNVVTKLVVVDVDALELKDVDLETLVLALEKVE